MFHDLDGWSFLVGMFTAYMSVGIAVACIIPHLPTCRP